MSGLAAELSLFLRSRSKRRLATEEEAQKLLRPLPPPPGFPDTQGPIGPSVYAGIHGFPVNDGGNGASAAILDQVEFSRCSPLPGHEDRPLRMDWLLSAHTSGRPIGPYGNGHDCSHKLSAEGREVIDRIAEKSGFKKAMAAMNCDDISDDIFYQIMTEPATHAAFQESFRMSQKYLHEGVDLTLSAMNEEDLETSLKTPEAPCKADHGPTAPNLGSTGENPHTEPDSYNQRANTQAPQLTVSTLGDVMQRMAGPK